MQFYSRVQLLESGQRLSRTLSSQILVQNIRAFAVFADNSRFLRQQGFHGTNFTIAVNHINLKSETRSKVVKTDISKIKV